MFKALSPSDFEVLMPFRWRGVVYKSGSGLPPAMPQGAMHQFLHKNPPLIGLKSNGASSSKKTASRKKATKKTSKKTTKRS